MVRSEYISSLQTCRTHPVAEKLAQTRPRTDLEISYFNNNKVYADVSIYDRTFRYTEGYNNKLKRDDSEYTQVKGLQLASFPVMQTDIYTLYVYIHGLVTNCL